MTRAFAVCILVLCAFAKRGGLKVAGATVRPLTAEISTHTLRS